MAAIWRGGISFGLIYIPVQMYNLTDTDDNIDLKMVDEKDLAPIGYQKINKNTGKEVPYDRIAKAVEYKDKTIVLDEEDFDKIEVQRSKTMDILAFVPQEEIDTTFYEKPYILEPAEEAAKTYGLLQKAMLESGLVGVTQFVLRTRENLAIIRAEGDYLIAQKLYFAHEMLTAEELDVKIPKNPKLRAEELELAKELIHKMKKPFKHEDYKDTYKDSLMQMIKYKAANKAIEETDFEAEPTQISDLMSKLKQSLKAS